MFCRQSFALHTPLQLGVVCLSLLLAQPLLGQSLIGYWPLDGNGDETTGRSGPIGLIGNASFTDGRFGNAAHFGPEVEGIGAGFAEGADDDALDFGAGDFTVSLWVNYNTTGGEQILIEKFGPGGGDPGWTITKLGDGRLLMHSHGPGALWGESPGFVDGTWHHVVARRTGATAEFLVDGVSKGTADYGTIAISDSPNGVLLGKRNDGDGRGFFMNGLIKNAAMWNRGLSDDEVGTLSGGAEGGSVADGLLAHWPLNADGSDASGNGRDLTLHGNASIADGALSLAPGQVGAAHGFLQRGGDDNIYDFAATDFTVSVWVNYDDVAGEQILMEKFGPGGGGPGWTITKLGNGNLLFWAQGGMPAVQANAGFTADTWHHVAFRKDGTTLELFIDGAVIASGDSGGNSITDSPNGLLVGKRNDGDGRGFFMNGSVDDLAIFDYPISDGDISRLADGNEATSVSTNPGDFTLLAYYPLDGDGFDGSYNASPMEALGDSGFADGRFGQAASLGGGMGGIGPGSAYTDGDHTAFDFGANDLTVSLWVLYDDPDGEQIMVEHFGPGGAGPGWTLTKLGNNIIHFYQDGVGPHNAGPFTWNAGVWYHVVVRRTGNNYATFLNGELAAENTMEGTINASPNPLIIGKRNDGDGRGFHHKGLLDDIAVYSRALTDDEVGTLYNGGAGTEASAIPDGQVAYLPLGDGTDASGNGHSVIAVGDATFVAEGLGGGALQLAPGSDAVGPGFLQRTNCDSGSLNFGAGDFTASLWVNYSSLEGEQVLMEKFGPGGGGPGWTITKLGDQRLLIYGAGGLGAVFAGAPGFVEGSWHHVAARRIGSTVELLVDGVSMGAEDVSANEVNASDNCLLLGKRNDGDGRGFHHNGLIDDVALWSRGLSNAQIATLAAGNRATVITPPPPPPSLGLEGYWTFDDDGRDCSGNNRGLLIAGDASIVDGTLSVEGSPPADGADAAAAYGADEAAFDFGSNDFTVQAWVNYNDVGGEQVLLEKFTGNGGPGWTVSKLGNQNLLFYAQPNGAVQVPSGFEAGTWYHVVVRRSGETLTIFINGTSSGSGDFPGSINDSPDGLIVGMRNRGDGRGFVTNGFVNDVAIWSRPLSDESITELYNGGTPPSIQECPAPVHPPSVPENVTVAANGNATVSWTPGPAVAGVNVSGYNVYVTYPSFTAVADGIADTSVVIEGLLSGVEYCFEVEAVGDNGKISDLSGESCATTSGSFEIPGDAIAYYPFTAAGSDCTGNDHSLEFTDAGIISGGLIGDGLSLGDPALGHGFGYRAEDDDALDFEGNDFTVQAWVNYDSLSGEQILIEKFGPGGGGPGWTITKLGSGNLLFWAQGGMPAVQGNAGFEGGIWHHVVARKSGTTLELFHDGAVIASGDSGGNSITDSPNGLLLGKRNDGDGRGFQMNGRLDDVAIWNRAISDDEIATFASGKEVQGRDGGGLVGYWRLNGNGDDSSGAAGPISLSGNAFYTAGKFGDSLAVFPPLGPMGHGFANTSTAGDEFNFGASDFTVSGWVNYYTVDGEQVLIEKFDNPGGPGWTLTKLADQNLLFYGEGIGAVQGLSGLTAGTWHNVVARRSGDTVDIFVDSSSVASGAFAGTISDAANPLYIGRRNPDDGRPFLTAGAVDEITIWPYALSNDQIGVLYNNGSGTTTSDCSAASGGQIPGDCNQDGLNDMSDAICLLHHLFLGSPEELPCGSGNAGGASNVSLLDWNGDTDIDLTDGVQQLRWLFLDGPAHIGDTNGDGTTCVEILGCPDVCDL